MKEIIRLDLSTTNIERIQPDEIFAQIENYPSYYISTYGRCYTTKNKGKILCQRIDKDGYCHYSLSDDNGKISQFLEHRLVALTFIENDNPENTEVHHIKRKENPKNNYYKNLMWTSRENHYDLDSKKELYLKINNGKYKKFKTYTSLSQEINVPYHKLYNAINNKKAKFTSCGSSFYEIENENGDKYLISTYEKAM